MTDEQEVWERVAQTLAQNGTAEAVAHDMRDLPRWLDSADVGVEGRLLGVSVRLGLAEVLDFAELRDIAKNAWPALLWYTRLWRVTDVGGERVVGARCKRVGEQERAAGTSALLRLEVSLPWWLVATRLERERALHGALMAWSWDADRERVVPHRPDIVAHAATLGRYGATDPREVQAIAHAARHPLTLLEGPGGQLIWQPTQRALAAAAERMAARREEEPPPVAEVPRRRRKAPTAEA